MRITAKKCPFMKWEEAVIMPDHLHALIRMEGGHQRLGDVVGGFKAAVTRELRRRGDAEGEAGLARTAPRDVRIWHRNYYESIVRTPEAERRIAEYIRMNPWRCVQEFGHGLRGMGNPALWNMTRLGVLASRGDTCVARKWGDTWFARKWGDTWFAQIHTQIPAAAYLGGFHSPLEKTIFTHLLAQERPLIWCPAWGLERSAYAPGVREALEQNRMLILEMRNIDGNLAAAEQRNRFVLEHAVHLWLPHVTPGGMLDRLVREMKVEEKLMHPVAEGIA